MSKLKVSGNASGTGVITLEAPNTNTDRTITLPDGDISLGVGIDDNATSTAITIDASENVEINTGNLVIGTSGKGIDFSADGNAAGMTSEVLDDYETGTFTPAVRGSTTAGTATYTIATGFYEKIGSSVHFQLYLDWGALNGTGNLLVTGLPFSAANDLNFYTAISSYVSAVTLTANNVAQGFLVDRNSTNISCKQAPVGGGGASAIVVDAAGTMLLSGTYRAA